MQFAIIPMLRKSLYFFIPQFFMVGSRFVYRLRTEVIIMILGITITVCMTLIILTAILVVKPNKFYIEKSSKGKKISVKIENDNKKED